jgi:hypothetical protein
MDARWVKVELRFAMKGKRWWDVLYPAMVPLGVYWPLGVVVSILDTFHDPGLISLISVGEFFDALISSVQMI